jgi:predicted SAM-dependent methyltransferase
MADYVVIRAEGLDEGDPRATWARPLLYIHYGCGACAPEGWINFDASPRLKIERLVGVRRLLKSTVGLVFPRNATPGNIVKGLPVPDQCAAAVFCSHVLEHMPRDDVVLALQNTFRMLRPGGLFRLVVPDLQWRALRYLHSASGGDPTAADAFMQSCLLGRRSAPKGLMAWLSYCFGNSAHQWMYDFSALQMLLEETGFVDVRRCQLGDCKDPKFTLVEDMSRFFDGAEMELAIQAERPEPQIMYSNLVLA